MKGLLLLSILIAFSAQAVSIVPEKMVTPLLDLYSSQNKKIDDTKMEVRVSTFNRAGDIGRGRGKYQMEMDHYLKALGQAASVFRMIPKDPPSTSGESMIYVGTAFHIGENLVLTNQHVLSPDRTNTTECSGFQLHHSVNSDVFACKKVHYCNAEEDVCLIEMAPAKRCHNFLCTKKSYVEMKDGPALKLKASPQMTVENMDKAVMTCIGNTMGYGIHYSQGRGIRKSGERLYFFAPLRTGNSGGPLIGEDGLVWGVVKLESVLKVGEEAYNIAASMDRVIELMREQITDEEVLQKFNNAIVN